VTDSLLSLLLLVAIVATFAVVLLTAQVAVRRVARAWRLRRAYPLMSPWAAFRTAGHVRTSRELASLVERARHIAFRKGTP